MKKRVISVLLTLCLFVGILPPVAWAVEAPIFPGAWSNYRATVKLMDVTNAGSTESLFLKIYYNRQGPKVYTLLLSDSSDRGSTYTVPMTTGDFYPWEITGMSVCHEKEGLFSNAIYVDWAKVELLDQWDGAAVATTFSYIGSWLDNTEVSLPAWNNGYGRNLSGNGDFSTVFGGTTYLQEDADSQTKTFFWNKRITDQYSTYPMDSSFSGQPKFSVSVRGVTGNNQIIGVYDGLSPSGVGDYTYMVTESALRASMIAQEVNRVDITANLTFDGAYNQYKSYSQTRTYIVPAFGLGNPWVLEWADKQVGDICYYNQGGNALTLVVPVLSRNHQANLDNYDANNIAENFQGHATLRYGEDLVLEATKHYHKGSNLYFEFSLPVGYSGQVGRGIDLRITDMSSQDGGYIFVPMAETVSKYAVGGSTSDGSYLSNHQIDTKGVDILLGGNQGFDTYQQTQSFITTIKQGEPYLHGNANWFSYMLRGDGAPSLELFYNQSTTNVPYSDGYTYTIAPSGAVEGAYTLEVTALDVAGNSAAVTDTVKLDNIAPRTKVTQSEKKVGTQKQLTYDFSITDIQDAKLYYCFVKDGEEIPALGSEPEQSGTVENPAFGAWAFLPSTATTTALLTVNQGEAVDATLYWYAVDGSGNSTMDQGYQQLDVSCNNREAMADITYTPSDVPAKDYDIAFQTESLDNISMQYRWSQGAYTTSWKPYEEGLDLDEAYEAIYKAMNWKDGNAILSWYVTNHDSGDVSEIMTKEFAYDFGGPTVKASLLNVIQGVPTESQRVYVEVSDVSSLDTITYWIEGDGKVYDKTILDMDSKDYVGTIVLTPETNGAYTFHVEAVDIHGHTSNQVSTNLFYIRRNPPQVTCHVATEPGSNRTPGLTLILDSLTEDLVNPRAFLEKPGANFYYQTSFDGVNYSSWTEMEGEQDSKQYDTKITADGVAFAYGVGAESQDYVLNVDDIPVGKSQIHVRFQVCYQGEPLDAKALESRCTQMVFSVIKDFNGPTYTISQGEERLKAPITWKIEVADDATAGQEIQVAMTGELDYVTLDTVTEVNAITGCPQYFVTFTDNHHMANDQYNTLILTDEVGNETEIPLKMTTIEQPATVEPGMGQEVIKGARTDYVFDNIVINGMLTNSAQFAVVSPGKTDGTLQESDFAPKGNVDMTTTLVSSGNHSILGTMTGNYQVLVQGDGTYQLAVKATNSVGDVTMKIVSNQNFTVVDALPEVTETYYPKEVGDIAPVRLRFNVPVQVFAEDGETPLTSGYSQMYQFRVAQDAPKTYDFVLVDERQRLETITVSLYNVIYGVPIEVPTEVLTTWSSDYMTEEDKANHKEGTHFDALSFGGLSYWLHIGVSTYDMYTPEGDVEPTVYPTVFYTLDESCDTSIETGEFCISQARNTPMPHIDPYTQWADDVVRYPEIYFLADSMIPRNTRTVTFYSHHLMEDGAGGYLDPTDLNNYETQLNVRSLTFTDVTGLKADYTKSSESYSKDLEIYFSFYDPEAALPNGTTNEEKSGVKEIVLEEAVADGYETTTVLAKDMTWDEASQTLRYTYQCQGTGASEEGARVMVWGTNRLGIEDMCTQVGTDNLVSYAELEQDTDYTITYTLPNGAVADPTKYYNQVIATVAPVGTTYQENPRGIGAVNNGGNLVRTLTPYDPVYILQLQDQYGYGAEETLSWSNFDLMAPTIESIQVIGATAILTVSDNKAVESVRVGESVLQEDNGTYTFTATENGAYRAVVTDAAGNSAVKQFAIDRFDNTAPTALVDFNTTLPTTKNVITSLRYSEAEVTVTTIQDANGVALYQNGTIQDDTILEKVDGDNGIFTWKKNASVTVEFVDRAGNLGYAWINVANIDKVAPDFTPKITPNNTKSQVTITFENQVAKDTDSYTVMYGGNVQSVETASYTLRKAGTYGFYLYDALGNVQKVTATVADSQIDTTVPTFTEITWDYSYFLVNPDGTYTLHQLETQTHTVNGEGGYNVATDVNPATNQTVEVTVSTGEGTILVGTNGTYVTSHTLTYDQNGLYNFHVQKENGMTASYGVGIYVMDKEAPKLWNGAVGETIGNLIFFENSKAGNSFQPSKLTGVIAVDNKEGCGEVTMELKDYSGTVVTDYSNLVYDRTKPYTATYTAYDAVGNKAQVIRTITLVGMMDAVALVNGTFPDSGGRVIVTGDDVTITIQNSSATVYGRYSKGNYTMGQMKQMSVGLTNLLTPSGTTFRANNLTGGWYTFYLQSSTADYFTLRVFVTG